MTSRPSRTTATLIGFSAILLWATLAGLTAISGTMPAFQLTAVTFAIGGVSLLVLRPRSIRAMSQRPRVWLLGVTGLFGYHAAYFFALRHAPPVEAGLINYLWPVLIVVFSALLPGERLRWQHIAGSALALCGAALVVTRGQGFGLEAQYLAGYAAALLAALLWSSYSVLSRRFAEVSSDAVTGFCLATALLAAASHLAFETTVWPTDGLQWAAIVGLGLGPVGLAFYVWDIGVKRGDIQVLGAASYATPLLSTLVLIGSGIAAYSHTILAAAVLIVAGAVLAAKDLLLKGKRASAKETLFEERNSPEDEDAYQDLPLK